MMLPFCFFNSLLIYNACTDCGAQPSTNSTESMLSEGNMLIVAGVAAAVIFGLGGFNLGRKKKKPALASVENKDEE